jgi:hypothetical protein
MSPQIDTTLKKLLREGRYWEALKLPLNSPWSETVIRIATLEQSNVSDPECLALLASARKDIAGKNFRLANGLCDEIARQFGQQLNIKISEEDRLTREYLWQECIHEEMPDLKEQEDILKIKPSVAVYLRNAAVSLGNMAINKLPEKKISYDTAIQALEKSVKALEVAMLFSPKDVDIKENLSASRMVTASLYCDRGIQRINNSQELHNSKMKTLSTKTGTGSGNYYTELKLIFSGTEKEIRGGVTDIERAVQLDANNARAHEQLEVAKKILSSFVNP